MKLWASATSSKTASCSRTYGPATNRRAPVEKKDNLTKHNPGLTPSKSGRKKLTLGRLPGTKVVPEFDAIDLHVKRVGWVGGYWLSAYLGHDSYPIIIPEWNGDGYIIDADGFASMWLRRLPMVTLRPGQGIRVVSCIYMYTPCGHWKVPFLRMRETRDWLLPLVPMQLGLPAEP